MRHPLYRLGLALCALLLCVTARADGALHPLWELHGKHNTVYLLGSIHVLRPSDYPLPAVILEAYANSKSVLMEVNLEEIDSERVQSEMLAGAILPEARRSPMFWGRSAMGARTGWRTRSGWTCPCSVNLHPGSPPRRFRSCS
jgi:hypothetical protein